MEIHTCRKALLGSPGGLPWRQFKISVPYWRVYWNNAPGSFVKGSAGEIELGPGKLVAIPPRTVYSTRATTLSTHLYLHFTVDGPYASISPGIMVFESNRLLSLASELDALVKEGPVSARTLLLAELLLCETLLAVPSSKVPLERLPDPRVVAALQELEAKPGLSNEELSRLSGMSRSSFLELFRRETGSAPQTLSRRKRLEKACMLLHFGGNSIKQIAEETGFFDRYHFSKAFKREYGMGPAKFRSQLDAMK